MDGHAHQYGGDPDNVVVVGHSAGAHLLLTLLSDGQYLREVGMEGAVGTRIRGVVGISGVYNIVRIANAALYGSLVVSTIFAHGNPVVLCVGCQKLMLSL